MSHAAVSENNEVSLSKIPCGRKCVVTAVTATTSSLRHKLLTMGVVAGTLIEVVSVAPLGDPMTIRTLGYSLSLRKSEAAGVTVSPL